MDAGTTRNRRLHRLLRATGVAALWALSCRGQTPLADGSTIHVYANLLQIPVLILNQKHQPLPLIDPAKFSVRLGKDQPFRPRLVRQEGEDPITLAILLDGSARDTLMSSVLESLPAMAEKQLSQRDRVALYAMDGCKLRRFSTLLPASALLVKDSVERAIAFAPYEVNQRGAVRCEQPVGLWDAMEYMTKTLAGEPGRRVVLAVTNGRDLASRVDPEVLRKSANRYGVTLFAIAERYKVPASAPGSSHGPAGWDLTSALGGVTEASGGMVIETARGNLPYTFKHFVELLRGRYIVEFSRPDGLTGGTSIISIDCGQPRAFIRPAGTSVPIADPADRYSRVAHGVSADAAGKVGTSPTDHRPPEAP